MMSWKRKMSSGGRCRKEEETTRERLLIQQPAADRPDGGNKGAVPRGCVALLVGEEERVVVEVRALGQPCVKALLDKAAREFGYDQMGVPPRRRSRQPPSDADAVLQAVKNVVQRCR